MPNTPIADANGVGRKDVYTKVTERIISDLEQGVRPWPSSERILLMASTLARYSGSLLVSTTRALRHLYLALKDFPHPIKRHRPGPPSTRSASLLYCKLLQQP